MWTQTERCVRRLIDVGTDWEMWAQTRTLVHILICVHEQINVFKLRDICTKWEECAQHDCVCVCVCVWVCVGVCGCVGVGVCAPTEMFAQTQRHLRKLRSICKNLQIWARNGKCLHRHGVMRTNWGLCIQTRTLNFTHQLMHFYIQWNISLKCSY